MEEHWGNGTHTVGSVRPESGRETVWEEPDCRWQLRPQGGLHPRVPGRRRQKGPKAEESRSRPSGQEREMRRKAGKGFRVYEHVLPESQRVTFL